MVEPLALWVTPVSQHGGVARHVLDAARAGIPGFRLAVLCPPGPLAEELEGRGAAVLTAPFGPGAGGVAGPGLQGRGSSAARDAAVSAATLRHAVRTLRPAVVHSHLAFADLVCAAVLRGPTGPRTAHGKDRPRGPVLVSTEHGIAGDPGIYHRDPVTARWRERLHTRRLRRTNGVVAVSEATAGAMARRWGARGVVVVPNGVDRAEVPAPREPRAEGPRLLSLTRLAPEKNLAALLESMVRLRTEHPGATLTLAGEGPQRLRLEAQVRRLGLEDRVSLPGHLPAGAALAEHDVVVQLSRWENCSYTLLDAAAAGLGVVATDVGGNREILPVRCLVAPEPPGLPERVAEAVARQLDPRERPGLPAHWPTVGESTRAVGELYHSLLDRTETPR